MRPVVLLLIAESAALMMEGNLDHILQLRRKLLQIHYCPADRSTVTSVTCTTLQNRESFARWMARKEEVIF